MTRSQRLLWIISLACAGCGGPTLVSPERTLPFTVRVLPVKLTAGEGEADPAAAITPAREAFGDLNELASDLADALWSAQVFTDVVTNEEPEVPADLDLEIELRGADFGPSQKQILGSIFSTFVWLFAGHLSWFIDDRIHGESDVILNVVIRPSATSRGGSGAKAAAEDAPEELNVVQHALPLNDIETNFRERSRMTDWLIDTVVPPFLQSGDLATTGTSLARRSVDHFAVSEPDRLLLSVAGNHLKAVWSYVAYDDARGELVLVSQGPAREVKIHPEAGKPRRVDEEELRRRATQGAARDEIFRWLADRAPDIGDSPYNRYYRIPLERDEEGYLAIEATLPRGGVPGRFTIYRPPTAGAE